MKKHLMLNNDLLNFYRSTGLLDLEKDKQATRQYFLEEINVKLRYFIDHDEKIRYLVDEGYYEKEFIEQYDRAFIVSLYEHAYSYNFRFPSFMSASKFYTSYAMKSRNDKEILEKYEDRVVITALYLANGNEQFAKDAVDAIMTAYQPATPTTLNSGKKARGELVSCFKLTPDDSMNSIAENLGYALELSRLGGGVGVNLTDLRPLGDPIKGILNRASGVMPVAKLLENSFSYSNQLGQRGGSGVIWLSIFHGCIESFISSKKPNSDEKIRLATLSTGVIIPNIFFELMRNDKDLFLFSPYDIKNEYGLRMSEINMTDMYYELLDNPNIRKLKRLNARQLYTEIKKAQFESGYPFEMLDDNVNNQHPLKQIGRVKMSNLCCEILQHQVTSVITDQNMPNEYGLDVSCNLGSIDVHEAAAHNNFPKLVGTAVRLLTSVSDKTDIVNVPSIQKANRLMHSIGLGVMNVHGHLVTQGILYDSPDAVQFMDLFMEAVNFYSLKASNELAKERNETFDQFEKSDYASGVYFDQYRYKDTPEVNEKVRGALGNVPIITAQMWQDLEASIRFYGLYNSYRLGIPPTGSISYVRNCSASMAPVTERVEIRDYADSRTIYPMPFLTNENKHLYVDAYEMNPYRMIDMYAAAQKHVDQGISMTLYVTDQWTTEQLSKVYIYAWSKGIKTVYYVRQRLTNASQLVERTIEECEACQV